jgi:hypothetical protein
MIAYLYEMKGLTVSMKSAVACLIIILISLFLVSFMPPASCSITPPLLNDPKITITHKDTDSESILLEVVVQTYGHTINSCKIEYTIGTGTQIYYMPVFFLSGVYTANVRLVNLPPDTTITYWGLLSYDSSKTITTDTMKTRTLPLPEIRITVSYLDSETVTFNILFVANGNELKTKAFESRLEGGDWIPHTTDTDNMMVGHMGLQPGTVIQYHGYVTYRAGGNVIKEIRTADATTSTNLLPVITINVIAVDYESATVQADIATNGNTISGSGILFKYDDTIHTITFNESHKVSPNRYRVVIPGLSAEDFIQIRGVLSYQVRTAVQGDIWKEIQGETQSVWTKKPPEYRIVVTNVDFNHVAFTMEVKTNGNPIEKTVFERRFYTNETWILETQTGGSSWGLSFSVVPGITTVFYRGYLICQTGMAKREFSVDEALVDIYTIHTKASWYQWYYNKTAKKGDLEVFGAIRAYKVSTDDISYLDKGFVWAENSEPVLAKDHVLSLGAEDLPDETVALSVKIRDIPVGRTIYYRAYAVSENGKVYYGHVERFDAFAVDVAVYTPTPTPDPRQGTVQTSTSTTASQVSETSGQATPAATASDKVTPVPATVSPEPTPASTESQTTTTTGPGPTDGSDQTGPGTEKPTDQQETAATNENNLNPEADQKAGSAIPLNRPWLWLAVPGVLVLAAGVLYYFIWQKRRKQQS